MLVRTRRFAEVVCRDLVYNVTKPYDSSLSPPVPRRDCRARNFEEEEEEEEEALVLEESNISSGD